jgi:nicotinate-nucleotide pyrophosphorylase (carboxylating)
VTEEVFFYEDEADVAGLAEGTVAALRAAGLDPVDVARSVRAALDEDFAYGPDVTSAATVAGRTVTADVVAREPGVLAGGPVALAVLDLIAGYVDGPVSSRRAVPRAGGAWDGRAVPRAGGVWDGRAVPRAGGARDARDGRRTAAGVRAVSGTVLVGDGERVAAGDAVLRVSGPAPAVLGAERTVLNFLTHLSGIATATRAWADAIEGTGAVVRDTRKTTPGLRVLEKYAVRSGGGRNHRMGLGDAALIKDNHVAAAGGVAAAVAAVRTAAEARLGSAAELVVEVECDSVAQVREALGAGAHFLLLDNMPVGSLREAVGIARGYYGVRLEASGGLRLANAREVAETGVDYLSVGALTHSSRALDLGLDFTAEE